MQVSFKAVPPFPKSITRKLIFNVTIVLYYLNTANNLFQTFYLEHLTSMYPRTELRGLQRLLRSLQMVPTMMGKNLVIYEKKWLLSTYPTLIQVMLSEALPDAPTLIVWGGEELKLRIMIKTRTYDFPLNNVILRLRFQW